MTYKLHSLITASGSFELRRYRTPEGKMPLSEWLNDLDVNTGDRISVYIERMKVGNFGNSRSVGEGISELKIDFGPGYRVYYLLDGSSVVVLLCGGDKGSQQKDIRLARQFATDYWRRK